MALRGRRCALGRECTLVPMVVLLFPLSHATLILATAAPPTLSPPLLLPPRQHSQRIRRSVMLCSSGGGRRGEAEEGRGGGATHPSSHDLVRTITNADGLDAALYEQGEAPAPLSILMLSNAEPCPKCARMATAFAQLIGATPHYRGLQLQLTQERPLTQILFDVYQYCFLSRCHAEDCLVHLSHLGCVVKRRLLSHTRPTCHMHTHMSHAPACHTHTPTCRMHPDVAHTHMSHASCARTHCACTHTRIMCTRIHT